MERPFVVENENERKRLQQLTEQLDDAALGLPMEDGWTVAVTFGHLAFWDQRSLVLLRKWRSEGKVVLSPIDIDITNEALLPLLRALPPRIATDLALAAAGAIDRELETYPVNLIPEVEAAGERYRLYRSEHRKWHLDRVESCLQDAGI